MHRLLGPMPYKYRAGSSDAFEQVVDVLLQRNPSLDGEADYNRIHRSLLAVIGTVQAAQPPVVEELKRRADSLHGSFERSGVENIATDDFRVVPAFDAVRFSSQTSNRYASCFQQR